MEDLDLKEVFNMFWSKKGIIILIVILFGVLGGLYSYFYVTPKYRSYTTLVLATSSDSSSNTSETITTSDITLNNNLVATYSELAKSKAVLRKVINNLRIDETEEQLKSSITVSAVKSTQVIKIDVTNEDSYKAKIIANELAKVFASKVSEIYNINNVHVVDEAEESSEPYNINYKKDIALFGAIGFVVACAYVFVMSLIDTTVKSKEDVERKLGLTVLVTIPACSFDEALKAMENKRRGGK